MTCSFGATDAAMYEIVGTKGRVRVEPADEYLGSLNASITVNGKTRVRTFRPGDQFAPQLMYFASCVQDNRQPEPNGVEGLLDVQIIEGLHRSSRQGRSVPLRLSTKQVWPDVRMQMHRPPVAKPRQVDATSPTL